MFVSQRPQQAVSTTLQKGIEASWCWLLLIWERGLERAKIYQWGPLWLVFCFSKHVAKTQQNQKVSLLSLKMGVLEISPYWKNLKEYGYYWYRDMSQSGLGSVQVLNGEPKRWLQKLYKTYALQESMYFFFPREGSISKLILYRFFSLRNRRRDRFFVQSFLDKHRQLGFRFYPYSLCIDFWVVTPVICVAFWCHTHPGKGVTSENMFSLQWIQWPEDEETCWNFRKDMLLLDDLLWARKIAPMEQIIQHKSLCPSWKICCFFFF